MSKNIVMKRTIIFSSIIVCLFYNCSVNKSIEKDVNLFTQYAFLLDRSVNFDLDNDKFKYEVASYIDTCNVLLKGWEDSIKPFSGVSRGGPIILHPFLFNYDYDEVILMVLMRDTNAIGEPNERVKFILGKRNNNIWLFKVNKGRTRNFSYVSGHPFLSDTEMSLRVLSTFIGWGYLQPNTLEINDEYVKDYIDKNWDR